MITLEQAAAEYLVSLSRANASPKTIETYRIALAGLTAHLGPATDLESIDLPHLRGWLAELYRHQQHPATLRKKIAAVRSLLQYALQMRWRTNNPAKLLFSPKLPQTLPAVPTEEQMVAVMEEDQPERDHAILELLYGCGLRVSECVGLNLEDLDRAERWLRVRGKGRKERLVPYASHPRQRPTARQKIRPPRPRRLQPPPPHPPPRLRHPSAQRWRRPPLHPGTPRPRPTLHHPALHPRLAPRPHGRLRSGPPPGPDPSGRTPPPCQFPPVTGSSTRASGSSIAKCSVTCRRAA